MALLLGCGARAMPPSDPMGDNAGQALFELVRAYAALDNHRVGTDVDRRTIDWFADALRAAGGTVMLQPFEFSRFDGTSRVTIDGELAQKG